MDSGTVGNGFVRVARPVNSLPPKVLDTNCYTLRIRVELPTKKNFVHGLFVQLGILQHLLTRRRTRAERVGVQLLETCTVDAGVEVDTLN
mmetsp:Transcript_7570/g.13382  ORF Transcript_7570/g.13382 Transcript_7570/m.13382 type:complete len:90 (-) Transcript_7570:353-622(-)